MQFLNTKYQVSFWNYLFLEFSLELELQQKVESFFLLVIQSRRGILIRQFYGKFLALLKRFLFFSSCEFFLF